MAVTVRTLQNFVAGDWIASTGENVRAIVSPVTGETIAEGPGCEPRGCRSRGRRRTARAAELGRAVGLGARKGLPPDR